MAWTAHQDEESMEELMEDQLLLEGHAKSLADLIRESKHVIIFTGAGVSTSAGIPDFRGPNGIWTLKAQGKGRAEKSTTMTKAVPTITHMAIVQLIKAGLAKYLVSQNVDGLHLKSGVPPSCISELHGNSNLEICSNCGKQYMRDYPVRSAIKVHEHATGRICDMPECGGKLMDSLINFNESLPEAPLVNGFMHAEKADLCLVLGSSLTVSPACKIPAAVAKHGKLVICNLQRTPYDDLASLRIHARCDDLMDLVLKELGLELPSWKLERVLKVSTSRDSQDGLWTLSLKGTDLEGTPSSYIRTIGLTLPKEHYQRHKFLITAESTQYSFDIKERPEWRKEGLVQEKEILSPEVLVKLSFYQHYEEPDMQFVCKIPSSSPLQEKEKENESESESENKNESEKETEGFSRKYLLEYDPSYRKFKIFDLEDKTDLTASVGRGGAIMGNPDDEETEKENENEKEEEREEELVLIRKLPASNPLILKAAPVSNVSNVKDETGKKSTLSGPRPRTVCIVNCKDCEYVIEGPTLKVVIEGCEGISVCVAGTVLSGVVEVINCKKANIQIQKNVPTLQIDGTQDCNVEFEFDSFLENVYTAKSKGITTCIKDRPVYNVECADGSWEDDQYITHIVSGEWITERVLRCSGGYATTKGEMDHYAEKEKQFDEAMKKFVAKTIQS